MNNLQFNNEWIWFIVLAVCAIIALAFIAVISYLVVTYFAYVATAGGIILVLFTLHGIIKFHQETKGLK